MTDAIKTARELALLPYPQRTVTERRGGRGGRDDRGPRGPRPDRDNAERGAEVEAAVEDAADQVVAADFEAEEVAE